MQGLRKHPRQRFPSSRRGAVTRLALTLTLVAFGGLACSFLIDVEPDCHLVADCTPYICNPENTSCLETCVDDSECAEGFMCQRGGDECVYQGCEPLGPPTPLFSMSGTGLEYDVDRMGDGYVVAAASSEGFGLLILTADGQIVGGETGMLVLDQAPAPPIHPMVVSSSSGANVFWQGETEDGRDRFQHYLATSAAEGFGPHVVFEGRFDQTISAPVAQLIGEYIALAWSTQAQRAQIEILPLNLDGTYGSENLIMAPNESAVLISSEETGSSQPTLAATSTLGAFAHRETVSGISTVALSWFDVDLQTIRSLEVSDGSVVSVEDISSAGMYSRVATAWIEVVGGARMIMRSVAAEEATVLRATPSNDFTSNPRALDIAATSNEFALVWTAEAAGAADLFMARYYSDGSLLYRVFPITHGVAIEPLDPRLVTLPNGYALFWIEAGVDPPEVTFQAYECTR